MIWMGKRKPMYRKHQYIVLRCYSEEGREYYTVVNTALEVHRHFDDSRAAITACRHAASSFVPKALDRHFKENVLYLMTGLEKYK
jgi:hypothetical protein